jgi:luciferase-like monooxygenase
MAGQLGMGDAALFLVPRWRDRPDRWFGWTEWIGLGTSIVLVALHNRMHLAKEVATLQELSGGRFTLGVGMGWHRQEFEFMGVEFKGRGRRADEAMAAAEALGVADPDPQSAMAVRWPRCCPGQVSIACLRHTLPH